MNQILLNNYLKIEPVEHKKFISSQKDSYEEIGTVIAKDESIINIPIGAKVWFDSFMCKKYPNLKEEGKYDWFVHVSEVVMVEV